MYIRPCCWRVRAKIFAYVRQRSTIWKICDDGTEFYSLRGFRARQCTLLIHMQSHARERERECAIDPCFSFFLRVSKTIFERIATRFRCVNVVGRFADKAKHQQTFARSLTLVEVAFSKYNRGMLMSKDRNVFSNFLTSFELLFIIRS